MRLPWHKASSTDHKTEETSANSAEVAVQTEQAHDSSREASSGEHLGEPGAAPNSIEATEKSPLERTESSATDASDGIEDETKYKHGLQLHLLTLGLAMTTFVVALDNTIIATAIPRITTVFDSLNDVGWYGSAYLLTTTSLQPTFGKVYQYFNIKTTYLSAVFIFEIGSVLCGAAVNSKMLIIGRAVAGVGAAALFSGGMTIIGYSVKLSRRPLYIGLLSSIFGISAVIGPLLGGVLTDKVSWRWCFYINLPIGGIAMAVVFMFFQNPERNETKINTKAKLKQMDLLGAGFLIAAIVCLLLALQWGGTVYPWSDSKVWGCLLGFGLLIIIFVGLQFYRGELATLPPRIIAKQRTVRTCAIFSALLSMGIYTHIYYLPFYFQAVKGTTAEGSGIRTIPYLVSLTISSVVVGGSVTVLGVYVPFVWVGSAIFTIGSVMIHTLKVDSSVGTWIGYQILAGAGAGACVQIPFIAVQVVLSKKDMPIGNATAIFFNSLGGAISISIAQNVFSNALVKELPIKAPEVDPRVIIAAGATHFRDFTPPGQLAGVLEAYNIALTNAYVLAIAGAALAFITSFMLEWRSVKGKLEMGAVA